MKTRQFDVTQQPHGHNASTRHALGQTVAPSLLLGPSTVQWKRKVKVSGTPYRGPEARAQSVRAGPAPNFQICFCIKSEAVPPRRVSRHSSLIGRGFGLDKVSEMTSTMHFIT